MWAVAVELDKGRGPGSGVNKRKLPEPPVPDGIDSSSRRQPMVPLVLSWEKTALIILGSKSDQITPSYLKENHPLRILKISEISQDENIDRRKSRASAYLSASLLTVFSPPHTRTHTLLQGCLKTSQF